MAFDEQKYNNRSFRNVDKVGKDIKRAYNSAINQISELTKSLPLNKDGEFYFSQYDEINRKVNHILNRMFTEVESTTVTGVNSNWDLAVEKNNEICHYLYGSNINDLPAELS